MADLLLATASCLVAFAVWSELCLDIRADVDSDAAQKRERVLVFVLADHEVMVELWADGGVTAAVKSKGWNGTWGPSSDPVQDSA